MFRNSVVRALCTVLRGYRTIVRAEKWGLPAMSSPLMLFLTSF